MSLVSKLNNFKVKPIIKGLGTDPEKIRGFELFPDPYANIVIIGPKAHGKTTIVYNIVEKVCYKNNVIIFSPTVFNDPTYKLMINMLRDKKKCNVIGFTHFKDPETGINQIDALIKLLQEREETNVELKPIICKDLKPTIQCVNFGDPPKEDKKEEEKKEPKPTKTKPLTAEYVIIYDDLSTDLRDRSVYQMLTKNRHFKCKNILCVHNSINLLPSAWGNIDYILFLANIPEDKFMRIQEEAGIQYPGDSKHHSVLYDSYLLATKEKYSFLYLNRNTRELRINFNKLINI